MAFKEVVSLECENTTALGGINKKTGRANPTKAEGYFLGSKEVESKKSKNGKAKIHVLQTSDGNLGVWGKTDLDRKMLTVAAGAMIRITQNGKTPTPNGDMYKYKVEVDTENTIDVGGLSSPTAVYEGTQIEEDSELTEDDLSFAQNEEVLVERISKGPVRTPNVAAARALLGGSRNPR